MNEARDAVERAEAAEKDHQEVFAAVEAVSTSHALPEAELGNISGSKDKDGSEPPSDSVEEANASSNLSSDNITSAWLSPWLWYYSSTTTTTTYDGGQTASTQVQGNIEEIGEKQTEQVVDENVDAFQQEVDVKEQPKDDEQQVQQRPQPQLDEPTLNTFTSSIISNTSGWASFFSSNKLLVKSLGYRSSSSGAIEDVKRDENGMEVMDLDFDGEEEHSSIGQSTDRGRGEETKDVGSESLSSNAAASGSSTPMSSLVKAIPIPRSIPQLMVSADVKRERDSAAVRNSNGNGNGQSTTAKSGATTSSASSIKTATSTTKKGGSGSGANTPVPVPASPTSSVSSKNASKHKKNNSSMSSMSDKGNNVVSTTTTTTTTTTAKVAASNTKRTASPTPSKKSLSGTTPPPPNVVLPSWQDTFFTAPRNYLPPKPERYADDQGIGGAASGSSGGGVGGKLFGKTMKFVSGVLFNAKEDPGPLSSPAVGISSSDSTAAPGGRIGGSKGKERMREMSASSLSRDDGGSVDATMSLLQRERQERFKEFGKELPKAWKVLEDAGWDTSYTHSAHDSTAKRLLRRMSSAAATHGVGHGSSFKAGVPPSEAVNDVLRGCKRVVVIGVHGWFPGMPLEFLIATSRFTYLRMIVKFTLGAMIRTVLGEVRVQFTFVQYINNLKVIFLYSLLVRALSSRI